MVSPSPVRMLLLAPDLLGESLALKLTSARDDWEVVLRPERLTGAPSLVIWSIDTVASLASLQHELFALQERWQPAPVLLLLPSELRLSREQLLELPAAGNSSSCSRDRRSSLGSSSNTGAGCQRSCRANSSC